MRRPKRLLGALGGAGRGQQRGIGHGLAAQVDADHGTRRSRTLRRLCHRLDGRIEPVLQRVDAQAASYRGSLATMICAWTYSVSA